MIGSCVNVEGFLLLEAVIIAVRLEVEIVVFLFDYVLRDQNAAESDYGEYDSQMIQSPAVIVRPCIP